MDRHIRQNGLAHSPKWTSVCMIHYTCVYIRVGWGLLRRGPRGPRGPRERVPSQPARICTHVWCIMHALIHFGKCANPFFRMRLFWRMSWGIRVFRYPGYNTITITTTITTTGLWCHWGVRKGRFHQSDKTLTGTGEKEPPNINVVGKRAWFPFRRF